MWHTPSNTGAFGEHGPTTVGLLGQVHSDVWAGRSIPICTMMLSIRIRCRQGHARGYGATQGIFAVESAVNELAAKMQMDPVELRLKNICRR
ncbi:MAG: molybdopterin cofactor-binding domain-containing protein [Coprococcus sp.]